MRVIDAARTGRYMHGNGGQWHILDEFEQKIVIDTVNGTVTFCPDYNGGEPHTNEATARNLEDTLMLEEAERSYNTYVPRWSAMEAVRYAVTNGELFFTNGGQWFVQEGGTVVCYELGINAPESARCAYSIHAAWKYMRTNGYEKHSRVNRTIVTEETRKFLGI